MKLEKEKERKRERERERVGDNQRNGAYRAFKM